VFYLVGVSILARRTPDGRERWFTHPAVLRKLDGDWKVVRDLTEQEERIFRRWGDGLPPEPELPRPKGRRTHG
jgi:hypothetical protein